MTITVIIVLVAGMTIMSIFTRGMSQVSGLSDQRASCLVQARSVCTTMNNLPAGWSTVATKGETCASATGCSSCSCVLGGGKGSEAKYGSTTIRELRIKGGME